MYIHAPSLSLLLVPGCGDTHCQGDEGIGIIKTQVLGCQDMDTCPGTGKHNSTGSMVYKIKQIQVLSVT